MNMPARLRSVNPFFGSSVRPKASRLPIGTRAGGGDTGTQPGCMDPKVFKALTRD